jgi:hypothetical protein
MGLFFLQNAHGEISLAAPDQVQRRASDVAGDAIIIDQPVPQGNHSQQGERWKTG